MVKSLGFVEAGGMSPDFMGIWVNLPEFMAKARGSLRAIWCIGGKQIEELRMTIGESRSGSTGELLDSSSVAAATFSSLEENVDSLEESVFCSLPECALFPFPPQVPQSSFRSKRRISSSRGISSAISPKR